MPSYFRLIHPAPGRNNDGPAENRMHWMQQRVAIRAVHSGGKIGAQRNRLANVIERKVWGIRLPVYLQRVQLSLEIAGRRQNSRDSWKWSKVWVFESVAAEYRR